MMSEYFNNLKITLNGVPAINIINFDETNFSDDPGQVKVVVKRGARHPERIVDTSKTNISVMMASCGRWNHPSPLHCLQGEASL